MLTPYSVLWLSAMESVVAFQSSEEMLALSHFVTMATVWHVDPVRLLIQPSTAVKIKEFITARERHPSSTSALIPSWDLVPPSSPSEGETRQQFCFALRDLDDAQLWEVLSEVHLKAARRKAVAPSGVALWPGRGS